ncbi:hypothetical protein KA183_20335 [bacterium]|nr:hypothetical protein [bacterium]QQR56392.1 MAG: hypothetical protein IPG59_15440 [Candidatus Melainabacteria bacterium]
MQANLKPISVALFYAIAFTFAQAAFGDETKTVPTTTEVNNLSTNSVDGEALPSGSNSLGFDQTPDNSKSDPNLPTVSTSSDDGNTVEP